MQCNVLTLLFGNLAHQPLVPSALLDQDGAFWGILALLEFLFETAHGTARRTDRC